MRNLHRPPRVRTFQRIALVWLHPWRWLLEVSMSRVQFWLGAWALIAAPIMILTEKML